MRDVVSSIVGMCMNNWTAERVIIASNGIILATDVRLKYKTLYKDFVDVHRFEERKELNYNTYLKWHHVVF